MLHQLRKYSYNYILTALLVYMYPFSNIFFPPLLLFMNSIITNSETNVRDMNLYTLGFYWASWAELLWTAV